MLCMEVERAYSLSSMSLGYWGMRACEPAVLRASWYPSCTRQRKLIPLPTHISSRREPPARSAQLLKCSSPEVTLECSIGSVGMAQSIHSPHLSKLWRQWNGSERVKHSAWK